MGKKPLGERVAALEVTVSNLNINLEKHLKSYKEFKIYIYNSFEKLDARLDSLDKTLIEINHTIANNPTRKLSRREKVGLWAAVITSVTAITIAIIQAACELIKAGAIP